MRESVEVKGRRYLAEGRLTVDRVDVHEVRARCRGDGSVYELGHGEAALNGERGWFCSCPASTRCAHLVALELVTVRPAEARPRLSRPVGETA